MRYRVADLPALVAGTQPALHPPMSGVRLSDREAEAIAAYLHAVQRRPQ
jgi:hypothetical protein